MRYLRQDDGSDHFSFAIEIDLIKADNGIASIAVLSMHARSGKIRRLGSLLRSRSTRESSPLMRNSHAIGRVDHFRLDSLALGAR